MLAKLIVCCGVGALAMTGSASAQMSAVPTDAFLGSLGVDTHVAQGYDYRKYIPALQYLGVRVIRDSTQNVAGLLALHRATGVRVDIGNGGDLKELLSVGRTLAAAGALLSFEGANEPNNFPITYQGRHGGGLRSWGPVAKFQSDLYASVKNDRLLKAYPVFHVSEGGAEAENVGMQWLTVPKGAGTIVPAGTKYADYANPHNYVVGNCHGYLDNQAWQAADPVLNKCWDGLYAEYGHTWARGFSGYSEAELESLPRVTTETGWDTVSDPGGEEVQGKVLTNTYLAQYARGWSYTFIYELGDGEGGGGHQGLFHADWTPKLAATYIHNLTSILGNTQSPASDERTDTLIYAILDKPATVHELLMQKPNGIFALAVWGEQVQGSHDVVIELGSKHQKVQVYDITRGTTPIATLADADIVRVTLSDHALIVEVTP